MSQAMMIRIQALEARVAELEQRMDPPIAEELGMGLVRVVHKGHGKYQVHTQDGVPVGTEYLSREEAETLADQLNGNCEALTA